MTLFSRALLSFLMFFYSQGWAMAFTLESAAFQHDKLIPQEYTCDGEDVSPALSWRGAPANTKSFALIMDDPDAPMGLWIHWVVFNIPPTVMDLPHGATALPKEIKEGMNTSGRTGYYGPCPPDTIHRYFFKLYALDTLLALSTGASKLQVEEAMKGHILAQAELMGKYEKQK